MRCDPWAALHWREIDVSSPLPFYYYNYLRYQKLLTVQILHNIFWVAVPNNLINNVGERACLIFWRNNISIQFREFSVRQNVFSAKSPFGQSVRSTKCPSAKCPLEFYLTTAENRTRDLRISRTTLYFLSYKAKLGTILLVCDVNDISEFFPSHAWWPLLMQRTLYMIFPWDSTRDVNV